MNAAFHLSHERMNNFGVAPCEGVKKGKPFGLLLSDMITSSVDAYNVDNSSP